MASFRVAAFAAMTSLACLPSVAQASTCWYPEEARAAQIRGLQTMLMVGTLQCRHRSRASEHLYTDFILNQRRFLDHNSAILKARFVRENGWRDAQGAYDRFATSLANRYSEQLDASFFCETVHRYARLAARASREQLMDLADAVAVPPMIGQCRAPAYVERNDRYAGPYRAPAPPRITVGDSAGSQVAPAPQPAEVEGEFAPASAPTPAEVAPQPAVQAQVEPAIAAPTPVEATVQTASQVQAAPAASSDTKLDAAIAALQSAVAALQAAKPSEPAAAAEPEGGAEIDRKAASPGWVTVVEVPSDRTKN